jgi:hypothetical protein
VNARKKRAVAVAKGRDKILREWNAALEARGNATKDQVTDTFLAGLARRGTAISRATLYGWEERRLAGGVEGLVDGRSIPRGSESCGVNGSKVTFDLPGVCLKVQIANALIDICERRDGLIISLRRRVDVPEKMPDATGVSKAI